MDNIKFIILIQKYIRRYLIQNKILIVASKYQTKKWRQNRSWYITGKRNECEKYQINLINQIIKNNIVKTDERINMINMQIVKLKNPFKYDNGFEFTEDFDGLYLVNTNYVYFNLKFICDSGGAHNRTGREVNHFIKCQLEHLLIYKTQNKYFMNILDGDTSYELKTKFNHLKNNEKYKDIIKYIFIGDMFSFQKYWINELYIKLN